MRLLTIHGAKGLEAQAVLLLDTDAVERNLDSMSVLVDWPGESKAPHRFVFLVSESRPPACVRQALATGRAARQREELNALYVALTRARQTLVISSIQPHRETTHSWWQRLQAIASPMPAPAAAALAAQAALIQDSAIFKLPTLPELAELAHFSEAMAATPAAAASVDQDSVLARIGKAMHRLLEWGGPASGQPAAALAAVAREFALSPKEIAEAAALAQRIRAGEGGWAWTPEALAWQGNEVELLHQGHAWRLDRLVQRKDAGHEGEWWVLDYKSASAPQHQPALVTQVQAYCVAVQRVYPGATVKAAFLTGLGTKVEVPEPASH